MTFDRPSLLLLGLLAIPAAAAAVRLVRGGALSPRRGAVLGALSAIAVLGSAFAAAGPRRASEPAEVHAVIAVDVSASMPGAALEEGDALLKAGRAHPAVVGRIVFDGKPRPAPERGSPDRGAGGWASGSDPAAALEVARAMLDAQRGVPPAPGEVAPRHRRVLLVSDGGRTSGDLAAAAEAMRAARIAVDVRIVDAADDIAVTRLAAPTSARRGELVTASARIASTREGDARVALLVDGARVDVRELALAPGEQPVSFRWRAEGSGPRSISVRVEAGDAPDARPANDGAEVLLDVLAAPRVLVVAPEGTGDVPSDSPAANGLAAAGFPTERMPPAALPTDPDALLRWELVVLDGVDADALGVERISMLGRWVRRGGALVAFPGGGKGDAQRRALAKGSSPAARALRALLPLATVDDEKKEPPPVAMVFILDKSDSMHRERKWEAASRTTASAWDELNKDSTVGVVAFSDFTDWVVPLAKAKDIPDFGDRVLGIRLSGGTDMFPALEQAFAALGPVEARLKHIVLLSDGVSTSRLVDHEALVRRIAEARITVSTVAMGSEADRATMERIASLTGGRYWFVEDPDDLPRIFAEETRRSQKDDVEPLPVGARRWKRVEAIAAVDPAASAWESTTHARTRATAETIWQLDLEDAGVEGAAPVRRPLLARARVGEGNTVAMAAPADAGGADARGLFGGLVHLALRPPRSAPTVRAWEDGGRVRIAVDGPEGAQGWSVQVVSAQGAESRLPVDPGAAGRAGIEVGGADASRLARVLDLEGRVVARVSLPGSGEAERRPPADAAALRRLAAATGGEVLEAGARPSWMAGTAPARERRYELPAGLTALLAALGTVLARRPPGKRT